jgi:hypothetical protein
LFLEYPHPILALAMFFIRLHGQGLQVAAIFRGFWLFPLGLLVTRCGFIPKVMGILPMIAGLGHVLDSFTSLILPSYAGTVGAVAGILVSGGASDYSLTFNLGCEAAVITTAKLTSVAK